ncbi:17398_t:CDS:2, partial [Rhizophagus irregularis]
MVEHSENQRKWLHAAIVAGHIISIPFATFDQAEIVARGAFGEVSRAYWKSAEKTVALKSLYNNPVMGTEVREDLERLQSNCDIENLSLAGLSINSQGKDNNFVSSPVSEFGSNNNFAANSGAQNSNVQQSTIPFGVAESMNPNKRATLRDNYIQPINNNNTGQLMSPPNSNEISTKQDSVADLHKQNPTIVNIPFGVASSMNPHRSNTASTLRTNYLSTNNTAPIPNLNSQNQSTLPFNNVVDQRNNIVNVNYSSQNNSIPIPQSQVPQVSKQNYTNMSTVDRVEQKQKFPHVNNEPPSNQLPQNFTQNSAGFQRNNTISYTPRIDNKPNPTNQPQSNQFPQNFALSSNAINNNSQGFQGSHTPAQQQLSQPRPYQQPLQPQLYQQPQPRSYQPPQPQSYQQKPYQQQQPYQPPQQQPYQQQPPQPQPYQQQPPQPRPYQPPQQQPYQQQPPQLRPQNYNNNVQSNPMAQQQNHTLHSIPSVQNQVLQHHSNQYHPGIQNQPGLQRNNTMRQQQYSPQQNFPGQNPKSNTYIPNQPPSQPFNNSYPHHPPQRPVVHPSQNPYKCTCADIMTKYVEEFQTTRGYEMPGECHAGYHAGMGDVVGLRWHLCHDRRVDGNYKFVDMSDKLVLIAARYCGRKYLNIMFQCLKEYGASFEVTTKKKGQTAFHLLFFNKVLSNKITYSDDKLNKYHKVYFHAIKFLKEVGCNINAKDEDGMTVLSYFLGEKFLHAQRTPIIQTLLDNGADPNMPVNIKDWGEFDAKTSLLQAVRNKWPTTVLELIVKHGVDVKAINNEGMNALAIATQHKDMTTMTWMLDNISIISDSDSIKIAKKFAGNFTTKESQLLSKKRNKVLPNDLSSFSSTSSSTSNVN